MEINRHSATSKILDSILKEDAELKRNIEATIGNGTKVASPMMFIADNLKVIAMSQEEIIKNLKLLSDPETAKQVGEALKRSMSGEEIKISSLPQTVGIVLMTLMTFLGPLFAQDPDLKTDMANTLKLKTVELADVNQFKEDLEGTSDFLNALNQIIKSKDGREIPGFASANIGGNKLTAKNKNQADMLTQMAKIDVKMKRNKAKGFMSNKTYEKKINAMIKAFNTGRPVVM